MFVILALTALAPLLGGSVRLWAQAAIALGTGLLFLAAPPERSLGPLPNGLFLSLFALALLAFLPAAWFSTPPWRSQLLSIGVRLPSTVTPQPWLTLQLSFLFLLQLSWTYYLLAREWSLEARWKVWVAYGIIVVGLAAMLTTSRLLEWRIPFWPRAPEFGFFPNRNHSSNVLGIGGILIYALALRGLDAGRKTWWIWIAALTLICSALILNFSRSGIIILSGGIVSVHCAWFLISKARRRPLVSTGLLLLLVALFVGIGGRTMTRFVSDSSDLVSVSQNVRIALQRDAVALSARAPVTGVGLGNFSPIFTMDRHDAIPGLTAAHPESDWAWAAVELGWAAPIFLATLFCWWAAHSLPFAQGTFRLLRVAAFTSVCGFALHSLFDVPAHQVGALWPALLLAGTALNPQREFSFSLTIPFVFRSIGLALLGIAGVWFASLGSFSAFPTRSTLDQLKERMRNAREQKDYPVALEAATGALQLAPLDWGVHQARGAIALAIPIKSEAIREFAAARALLPYWSDLRMKQGLLWAEAGDIDRAFDLWAEAMKLFPAEAPDLYAQIHEWVKDDPELMDRWRELGRGNKDCLLFFFSQASPFEFALELGRLLTENPALTNFTPPDLKRLFAAWYKKGDRLALAETLQEHPEWGNIAWRELALAYADYQDYRPAYETAARFAPPPSLPSVDPTSIGFMAAQFRVSRDIGKDGLLLATAQFQTGADDEALRTISIALAAPRAPRELNYLAAQIWARKGHWQKAWEALREYAQL